MFDILESMFALLVAIPLSIVGCVSAFAMWMITTIRLNTVEPAEGCLHNEIVLITGGAGGLGSHTAMRLARLGATVALWDLSKDALHKVATQIRSRYPSANVLTYIVDVSSGDKVRAAAARLTQDVGNVTILVNNAGIVSAGTLLELSDAQIERTFAVNTLSQFYTTKAFLPSMMEANSGCIVTVASVLGRMAAYGVTDYAASKHACVGFHNSLVIELMSQGKTGVTCPLICPATIATPLFQGAEAANYPTPLDPDYVAQHIVAAILAKHNDTVCLPQSFMFISFFDALPNSLKFIASRLVNAQGAMDAVIRNKRN